MLAGTFILNLIFTMQKKRLNRKYILIPAIALIALLAGQSALAYGGPGRMMLLNTDPVKTAERFDSQIANEAQILGLTVDEVKNYWAQGKNISDIAKSIFGRK